MKNTAFIVCEYDPFHNGHALHMKKTREAGAERIVCLMSGNFVQRGEIAFCDKYTRARFAIENGADLVLELPLKNVVSGASYFARGAAEIMAALHITGTLSFGASAPLPTLQTLAALCRNADILAKADSYSLSNGASFARAMQIAISEKDALTAEALSDPNNILAVEYINALKQKNADIDIFAVARTLLHNGAVPEGDIASAKYIRDTVRNAASPLPAKKYMPPKAFDVFQSAWDQGYLPADKEKFSVAAMTKLMELQAQDLLNVNGVNQGLENRILQCLRDCSDLYMLFDAVKTKRFTHARIRQILISAVLGINKEALEQENPYIRVLGMNQKGRALLREINGRTDVPLVMKLSDAPESRERSLDARSGKLYDLCRPKPVHKNPEYALTPYVSE